MLFLEHIKAVSEHFYAVLEKGVLLQPRHFIHTINYLAVNHKISQSSI